MKKRSLCLFLVALNVLPSSGVTVELKEKKRAGKSALQNEVESSFEKNVKTIERSELTADSGDNYVDLKMFESKADDKDFLKLMYETLIKYLTKFKFRLDKIEDTNQRILNTLTKFDCSDLPKDKQSGVYTFYLDYIGKRPVSVYCDMETEGGGWTVVQRRLPRDKNDTDFISFNKTWHEYKIGFGNAMRDYWVGLESLYAWTNTRAYELRIELTDFEDNTAHAQYSKFYVDGLKHGYRLHVGGYNGTAGDSLTNEDKHDNFTADGMMFSTHDEDLDSSHEINCSKYWNIGGWWLNRCSWANLNAPYKFPGEGDGIGINWHKWRNMEYLKATSMNIRPLKKYN